MKTFIARSYLLLCLLSSLSSYITIAQPGLRMVYNGQQPNAEVNDTLKEWRYDHVLPLANGFAHNDYLHQHPLFDALGNGFTNIEADIFLEGKKLIVAHYCPFFKSKRTLEALYLEP